ncbi:MAG: S8/S53 family peptidase [Halobacteriovoraceae bacterium]|nr:S8/S53 family peptidase [Halobacteriovoraceae bacterium]
MEQDKVHYPYLENVNFAVFDLGFEKDHITLSDGFLDINVPPQMNGRRTMRANHGTSVLNLLTGPKKIRMTEVGKLISLAGIQFSGQYHFAFRKMEERGVYPKVVSNSLGWNSERIPELVNKVTNEGVLWALAAGNSFPEPVKKLERRSKALLVGSFAPNGMTSYEAQIHKDMVILAPANKELLTLNGNGEIHSFGASSGATPIVAATLINMVFYLPTLNRDQAIKILKHTGWKSMENKLGFKKLPPLLNSFKAVMYSRFVYLECGEKSSCIDKKINNDKTFDDLKFEFKWNSKEKNLRAQALMGQQKEQNELIELYQGIDLFWNASFFSFIKEIKPDWERLENWTDEAINLGLYEFNSFRYFPYYSKELREKLKSSPNIKDHHKMNYLGITKKDLAGIN